MKKWKVLLPTVGLISGLATTCGLVCATKVQKTSTDVNERSIGWSTDSDYEFGEIDATGATTEITEDTKFSALVLPEVNPDDGCELIGWFDDEGNQLRDDFIIQATGEQFNIHARFNPILKNVNIPQIINLSMGHDYLMSAIVTFDDDYDPTTREITPKLDWTWKIEGNSISFAGKPTSDQADIHPEREGSATVEVSINGAGDVVVKDRCSIIVTEIDQRIKKVELYDAATGGNVIKNIELESTETGTATKDVYIRINDNPDLKVSDLGIDKFQMGFLSGDSIVDLPALEQETNKLTFSDKKIFGRAVFKLTAINPGDPIQFTTSLEISVKPKFVAINEIILNHGSTESLKVTNGVVSEPVTFETKAADERDKPTYPNSIIWSVTSGSEYIAVDPNGRIKPLDVTPEGTTATLTATATDDPTAEEPVTASIPVEVQAGEWTVTASTTHTDYFTEQPQVSQAPSIEEPEKDIKVAFTLVNTDKFAISKDQINVTYGTEPFDDKYISISQDGQNPLHYIVTISWKAYTDLRVMNISVDPQMCFTIMTTQLEGIKNTTIDDAPIGQDITGKVEFLSSFFTELNISKCYVEFEDGSRLYGDDVFIYDSETPDAFALDHTALGANTHFEVCLDASTGQAAWNRASVSCIADEVEAHLAQNIYGQVLLVDFTLTNGYKLDIDSDNPKTKAVITEIKDGQEVEHEYTVLDETGVFTLNNDGYLQVDTQEVEGFTVTQDTKIVVSVAANQDRFPVQAHTTGQGFSAEPIIFAGGHGQLYKDIEFTWALEAGYTIDPFDRESNYITVKLVGQEAQRISFTIDTANTKHWSFKWNYQWGLGNIEQFDFYVTSIAE